MKRSVHLFAAARQTCGRSVLQLELPATATVGDLRRAIVQQVPDLAPLLPRCHLALDNEYAPDTQPLASATEIACIPPVSGG